MKEISIIILCHNNRGINTCIKAILNQLKSGDEIIIIDDHSDREFINTELSEFVTNSQIHLFSGIKKCGNRAYNRNLGAQNSKNEILLFIDGDMICSQETLEAFRTAHNDDTYVAFLGNAHGMRFSEEHMMFHIGRRDYCELVQTKKGIQQLIEDPALADWRISQFLQTNLEPYYWIYYYTCICSAKRSTFLKIKGFDEALVTWGSEDIDLGYRLSRYGKIGYAANAHAVHLPHKRNLWDEQLFDRDNMRYLLDKHQVWPYEMLMSFEFSPECYELVEQIYNDIIAWDLQYLPSKPIKNSIWINVPSVIHNEDTIVLYDHMAKKTSMPLLGISVPFSDKRFDTAYISANIFSYPMEMTARIIQEAIRISQQVVLIPSKINKRKTWDKAYLLHGKEIYRTYYVSSDTMEFEFSLTDDGNFVVSSPQILNKIHASRSRCPVHVSAASRITWHEKFGSSIRKLLLINLLEQNTDEIRIKLENALDAIFVQQYHFTLEQNQQFSLTENLSAGLSCSKLSILFVVHTVAQITDSSIKHWVYLRKVPDFVLSLDGSLKRLGIPEIIS